MSGQRCAFMHPEAWAGQCGRYVSPARAAAGDRLCSVHDPKCKAKTRGAHIVRMVARQKEKLRPLAAIYRDALIAEIKEIEVWWDGPGSEGRCV